MKDNRSKTRITDERQLLGYRVDAYFNVIIVQKWNLRLTITTPGLPDETFVEFLQS